MLTQLFVQDKDAPAWRGTAALPWVWCAPLATSRMTRDVWGFSICPKIRNFLRRYSFLPTSGYNVPMFPSPVAVFPRQTEEARARCTVGIVSGQGLTPGQEQLWLCAWGHPWSRGPLRHHGLVSFLPTLRCSSSRRVVVCLFYVRGAESMGLFCAGRGCVEWNVM